MRLTIYINQDKSFTVNAFDNDGFTAGAISTRNTLDVVRFIDTVRNKEPEAVQAKVIDHNGVEHTLSSFSTRTRMKAVLDEFTALVQEVTHA